MLAGTAVVKLTNLLIGVAVVVAVVGGGCGGGIGNSDVVGGLDVAVVRSCLGFNQRLYIPLHAACL